MDTVSLESAFGLFICSLSCLTAAGLLLCAVCRGTTGARWMWLASCAAAQGWADLMGVLASQLGESPFFAYVRLAAWTISLAALVEFGQASDSTERRWLLGRWIYPILLLAAVPAVWLDALTQFDLAVRLGLALQACLLGGFYLWRTLRSPLASEHRAAMITVVALMNYALLSSLTGGVLRVLAALLAVACVWWVYRSSSPAEQRGGWARQGSVPAAFVLLVALGWFVLPGSAGDAFELEPEQSVAEAFDTEGLGGGPGELSAGGEVLKQLGGCGLAILLPLLLVGITWGLSRVPGIR